MSVYRGPARRAPSPPPVPAAPVQVRLSAAVQSHPKRAGAARVLADQIGAEIVADPEPDGFPSPWRTYRLALERTPATATHRMIVQDDVVLCGHFNTAVAAALREQPDRMLVLFHGGQPRENLPVLQRAQDQGEPWAALNPARWIPAVAVVWPTRIIAPFLRFVDEQGWPPQFHADDEIIGRGLRALGEQAVATVPSLVEHPDIVPSLVGLRAKGGEDKGRIAAHFTGWPPSAWHP